MDGNRGLIEVRYKTRPINDIDKLAKKALERILPLSILHRCEIGGMIYRATGGIVIGKPRTARDGGSVPVGLGLPNHGCPDRTVPLASYHTHPVAYLGGMLVGQTEIFSSTAAQGIEGRYDEEIAVEHGINSYLGTMLGRFLIFEARTRRTFQLGQLKNGWDDADKRQIHDIGEIEIVT